jgi:hypothetical protein
VILIVFEFFLTTAEDAEGGAVFVCRETATNKKYGTKQPARER